MSYRNLGVPKYIGCEYLLSVYVLVGRSGGCYPECGRIPRIDWYHIGIDCDMVNNR